MAAPEETSASRYVKLVKEQEAPVEDIRPGELNQPVHVPQLVVHKCAECGQPLPDSYEPPSNEPWTTGILGCGEDMDSFWMFDKDNSLILVQFPYKLSLVEGWRGFFCPCVLFGHNVERMKDDVQWTTPCVCHAIFVEGGIALGCVTLALHGLNPKAVFLIGEGLVFAWWMCGIYTGLFRQELQRKYHLQNKPCDPCMVHCCLHWCALCQEHREMQGRLSDNLVMPMTVINPPEPQEMGSRDTATVEHKEHAEIQLSEID